MDKSILDTLAQLMQKNRATDQQTSVLGPTPPPVSYTPPPRPVDQTPFAQKGSGTLGFLGGLGDSTNPVTGVMDPSIMTQLNQFLMKNSGQLTGQPQSLPWQTTEAQQAGQNLSSSLAKLFGG